MRILGLLPFLLLGCPQPSDDTATDSDADTDTDTDTDADSDSDSDTDDTATTPEGAMVTGCVVAHDGTHPADLDIQFCETVCYTVATGADGCYTFTDMQAGSYKLDAVGEAADGKDYGRIRVHVELGIDDVTVAESLFLPKVYGPVTATSAGTTQTLGDVRVGFDLDNLTVPFGYDEDQFWAGSVTAGDIPGLWGVTPSYAIAFLPLATEVSAAFTVSAVADLSPGTYTVYSVDEHGLLEGPVGSTTVGADGEIPATSVSPSILTWLLFVPA